MFVKQINATHNYLERGTELDIKLYCSEEDIEHLKIEELSQLVIKVKEVNSLLEIRNLLEENKVDFKKFKEYLETFVVLEKISE